MVSKVSGLVAGVLVINTQIFVEFLPEILHNNYKKYIDYTLLLIRHYLLNL